MAARDMADGVGHGDARVRPKASETPSSPMPTSGKAAAMTALPQPAKVSQNVPMASAASLRMSIALSLP